MNRREQELQRTVVQYLALALPRHIVLHPPMGGARTLAEGAIFKHIGARAGAADLLILGAGFSGCIELKDAKGRQSQAQLEFQLDCDRVGVPYALCRSVEEVEAALRSWGLEVRASVS